MTDFAPSAEQRKFGEVEAVELGVVRGIRGWGPPVRMRCYNHTPRDPVGPWRFAPLTRPHDCLELFGMYRQPWRAGVNIANCMIGKGGCTPPLLPSRISLECRCGFYAYWGGSRSVWGEEVLLWDGVLGVIEGYGVTVIGEKGFRCQKARILALTISIDSTEPHQPHPRRIRDRSRAITALRRHYGVPVYERLDRMFAAHPPDDGPVT